MVRFHSVAKGGLLLFALLLSCLDQATSTHLRSASISWRHVEGNTVEVSVHSTWTRDYGEGSNVNYNPKKRGDPSTLPSLGDVVIPNGLDGRPLLNYGDGTSTNLEVEVLAYSVEENWYFGVSRMNHTYRMPSDVVEDGGAAEGQSLPRKGWLITYTGCCLYAPSNRGPFDWDISTTPSTIEDRSGELRQRWRVEARVDMIDVKETPVFQNLPIISVEKGLNLECFAVPALLADGTLVPIQNMSISGVNGVVPDAVRAGAGGENIVCIDTDEVEPGLYPLAVTAMMTSRAKSGAVFLLHVRNMTLPQISAVTPYPSTQTCYSGFPCSFTVTASSTDPSHRISYSVMFPPAKSVIKPISGINPASITVEYLPCTLNNSFTCFAAHETSAGVEVATSEQLCVHVDVKEDPAPVLNSTALPSYTIFIGEELSFTVTSSDANRLDRVRIEATNLPTGATFDGTTFKYRGAWNHGGMQRTVCFRAYDEVDRCGSAETPSNQICTVINVKACKYLITTGRRPQSLHDLAALYNSDWMTMWAANPDIHHPDFIPSTYIASPSYTSHTLSGNSAVEVGEKKAVNIGRMKKVEVGESMWSIAKRYGTSVEELQHFNYGVTEENLMAGQNLCISLALARTLLSKG
eukprot:CAMPEP_0113910884 /NCGR_PEP_ID=MMETSP0780_2-20120614/27817_1 /TAXON_ID=652834 /ORGANISM="Palpitomonas bilix" /LENGTH=634 /DNA_ID=CAMNT_0000907177 /DNA_START=689 /DNA_END=2590 /DNA_ORIENTATION=- /assembly_acc=CAM_ASM_000599